MNFFQLLKALFGNRELRGRKAVGASRERWTSGVNRMGHAVGGLRPVSSCGSGDIWKLTENSEEERWRLG